MKVYYVYRHIRSDTEKPFYVGKGTASRAYSKYGRNQFWKRIVNKTVYRIEIVRKFYFEDMALAFEKKLIKAYRLFGFCEANITDGGEGTSGYLHSEQTKDKIAAKAKGRPGNITRGMLGKTQSEHQKETVKQWHLSQGENHPQFKGYWITPGGKFTSKGGAAKFHGIVKCVVSQRCSNTSERFKDWYFLPKEKLSDQSA